VQSYAPGATTDAEILASKTAELSSDVCPERWSYPLEMAPPIAADVLGRPAPSIEELRAFVSAWPPGVEVGLIEGAGGVRSPLASDGDLVDMIELIAPDLVVLVGDAGLGVINAVRLSAVVFRKSPIVFLNRFDPSDQLHRENRRYLGQLGYVLLVEPDELVAAVMSLSRRS
jgi:dethiobiotin synthetase